MQLIIILSYASQKYITILTRGSKNLYYIGIQTSYVIHQHHDIITKQYINTSSFWIIIVICYLLLFDIYSYYLLFCANTYIFSFWLF